MVRNLLATTALAGLLATGAAFAQTAAPAPGTAEPAAAGTTTAPAVTAVTPADTAVAPAAGAFDYLTVLGPDQHLSDDLVGASVYLSAGVEDEDVAEIENLVVGADGEVLAVIIQTGSSLGAESREVAVPFDRFEWTLDENGDTRVLLTASAEEITAAPVFEYGDAAATAGAGTAEPSGMAAAPAGQAPADNAATGVATSPAQGVTQTTAVEATDQPQTGAGGLPGERTYLATLGPDQYLADDLVGDNVYSGPTTDTDNIGNINNLVISSNGTIDAFVVGVGGFLGIGQKDVGVPFDAVELSNNEDGEQHASLAVTREQLDEAPAFEGRADDARTAQVDTTTAPATGGMAAGTGAAATQTAQPAAPAGQPVDTTASLGGTRDLSGMTPVQGAELTADNLIGTTVYGPGDETIGDVGDIALSTDGQVDAIVIDVGGFLGIGAKPVAVSMDNLDFMRDSSGSMYLYTGFTQDQLEAAPEFDSDTYAQNRDEMLLENAPTVR